MRLSGGHGPIKITEDPIFIRFDINYIFHLYRYGESLEPSLCATSQIVKIKNLALSM